MLRRIIGLVLVALLPAVALADVTGQASMIDGDTLEVAGQRIRLHGIDPKRSFRRSFAPHLLNTKYGARHVAG